MLADKRPTASHCPDGLSCLRMAYDLTRPSPLNPAAMQHLFQRCVR
jgi:hypothetical protein